MDAVEISIGMEEDAIKFYKEAADKTSNQVGKKIFLSIMEDEIHHLEWLNNYYNEHDIPITPTNPMDRIKNIFEELKSQMQQKIAATEAEVDAFKIAMEMEQKGFEFYKKHAAEAPEEKERTLFEMLASEEEKHYKAFANTHDFLADSGNWFMWEEKGIIEG